MAEIALFHSVLGVRPGIHDAADRLRAHGHDVTVVDQYDGRVFDDYDKAGAFARSIGYPSLMRLALDAGPSSMTGSSRPGSPTGEAWPSTSRLSDTSVAS